MVKHERHASRQIRLLAAAWPCARAACKQARQHASMKNGSACTPAETLARRPTTPYEQTKSAASAQLSMVQRRAKQSTAVHGAYGVAICVSVCTLFTFAYSKHNRSGQATSSG